MTGGEDDKAYVWGLSDGEVLLECTGESSHTLDSLTTEEDHRGKRKQDIKQINELKFCFTRVSIKSCKKIKSSHSFINLCDTFLFLQSQQPKSPIFSGPMKQI